MTQTPPSKPNRAEVEDRIKCALCDSTTLFCGQKSWICPACSDWIQKMKAPRTEAVGDDHDAADAYIAKGGPSNFSRTPEYVAFLAGAEHGRKAERERIVGIISEKQSWYAEDIFSPLTAADKDPVSRDRVSAHMARHICKLIIEDVMNPGSGE